MQTHTPESYKHFSFDVCSTSLTRLPLDKMAAILADDRFKCIFSNENYKILISISLKFVSGPIDNKPTLVQVIAWGPRGDKLLSEQILTQFTYTYMQH